MLETLKEGKFPDFPVGLNDGVGVLLDEAGAPKIFRPGIHETEKLEEWMYGDYWLVFKNGNVNAIKVEPTRATITIDDVINALGPAENVYEHDVSGNMIYAYYEGLNMYEFMYNKEKVISITLKRWTSF
ncbi:hypothetical protein ABID52_000542 [Fictibacillus halophilus]|uniref:Uncharacterized protein n=1 Tax=Fictibacillus halophilus TaxID=1610490 RepID=A0ABV2LF53_9BACL|nr:hypothetical protein [Fictibacillus halophilus]